MASFTEVGIEKGKQTRFNKNHKPWNFNIPWSEEYKSKLSEMFKGLHSSPNTEFKEGSIPWNKGKEHVQIQGAKHYNWKGGCIIYYGKGWYTQKRKALERDNYMCQVCGKTKEDIGFYPHVHHIIPFRTFDNNKEANKLTNLVTLCPNHHIQMERGCIKL